MRISLSGSAAKAVPGSKVETAISATAARRESVDIKDPPSELASKTACFSIS
jgi:hypothetical protein